MKEIQPGVYRKGAKMYTKAASSQKVYGEKHVEEDGETYREWNPNRSKAGAAIENGVDLGIQQDDTVLYLGAASGTTVSHFSDILDEGFIFAVEYSDTVIRGLMELAEQRDNIAPILGNARNPEEYSDFVTESDIVFQDISQSDQAEIFIKNAEEYLKSDGTALLTVKAQSISTSRPAEQVFGEVKEKLADSFEIEEEALLAPHEKDHLFLKMKLS